MNLNLDRLLDLNISLTNQEFVLKHFEKAFHLPTGRVLTVKNILKRKESKNAVKKIYKKDIPVIREIVIQILFNKFIQSIIVPQNSGIPYSDFLLDHAQKERIKMNQLDLNTLISKLRDYVN